VALSAVNHYGRSSHLSSAIFSHLHHQIQTLLNQCSKITGTLISALTSALR
jgi:hypothetical protein